MSLHTEVKVVEVHQMNLEHYCNLHKSAFKTIFIKNKLNSSYLTPAYFQWKYNPPAGSAKIALVEYKNQLLASVAMYPVEIIHNQALFKCWHFVEAATLPAARGKGYFELCMKALIETLAEKELIYVFPNSSSIIGIKKLEFKLIEQLRFYARINLIQPQFSKINEQSIFHINQNHYANKIVGQNESSVYKSSNYMNWRYLQKPAEKYFCYSAKTNDIITGNIVLKPAIIRNKKILLIMEYHFIEASAKTQLNNFLKQVTAHEKCMFTGMFSVQKFKPDFLTTGMVHIPSVFMPKKSVLFSYSKSSLGTPLLHSHWLVQTGDWDAF